MDIASLHTFVEEFHRYRALILWFGHARPDLLYCAKKLAQVSKQTFSSKRIHGYNPYIKTARNCINYGHLYQFLDGSSVHIRCYANASFASSNDLSSQIGFLDILCNASRKCFILDYQSLKSRRVKRFALAAEVFVFS